MTAGFASADLLAADARNGLDQVIVVVVDAQNALIDFDVTPKLFEFRDEDLSEAIDAQHG
jgi:hypothetical protein